jgi:hypothetical protein
MRDAPAQACQALAQAAEQVLEPSLVDPRQLFQFPMLVLDLEDPLRRLPTQEVPISIATYLLMSSLQYPPQLSFLLRSTLLLATTILDDVYLVARIPEYHKHGGEKGLAQ